jgi:hypothetical protein
MWMDNDNGTVFLNLMIGYAEVFAQSMAMWLDVYVQAKRGEVKQVERSATAHARVTWHAAATRSNRMERTSSLHRHAARMKAQRMAWDYRVWAAWRESMTCGSRRSARPIGEGTSISANVCPCNQHNLRCSSPNTQRIPHAHGRRCVQPTAYDRPMHRRTGRWANQRIAGCTLCPPRSTLAALVLQRAHLRLPCAGWAHSARAGMRNAQQRLKRPARPGHPPFEEVRVLKEDLVVHRPLRAGRSLVDDRSHVHHPFQSRQPFPVISRRWGDLQRCKRSTCASRCATYPTSSGRIPPGRRASESRSCRAIRL